MRKMITIAAAVLLGLASSVHAQDYDRPDDSHRVLKVVIGAGALVAGTAVAAKSSKTTTTTGALGSTETSEFSTSQLITGLAVAGTGGFLLWDGLRDHDRGRPFTRVAVGVGKKAAGLVVQRAW